MLRLAAQLQLLTLKHFKNAGLKSLLNSSVRHDDVVDDFEDIIKSINTAISLEAVKVIKTLLKHFRAVRKFVDHSFKQSLAHVTDRLVRARAMPLNNAVKTVDIELLKKIWVEKNTRLIKDIPANALVKINDAVYDAVRNGESMQSLASKLGDIFQVTKRRAKMIACDQIAKLKSDISRHNDLTHGFTVYEWSSCKDGAVRDSHKVLEGKICSWLDATIYKNKAGEQWKKRSSIKGVLKHAGEDILCRCTNIMLQEIEVIR